jgi:hypothetical protein
MKLKQTIHGTPLIRTLYIKVFNEENKRYGLTIAASRSSPATRRS